MAQGPVPRIAHHAQAPKANERNLRTQYQGEQKQALIKQRELHRAAIAEVLDRSKARARVQE